MADPRSERISTLIAPHQLLPDCAALFWVQLLESRKLLQLRLTNLYYLVVWPTVRVTLVNTVRITLVLPMRVTLVALRATLVALRVTLITMGIICTLINHH